MTKSRIAKAVSAVAGLAMVLSAAMPAAAVTVADLQAQIAQLMAQLNSLQGGSATASVTFTRDLTVGSSGADVTALQQILVSKGYLTMPAGVAYGYFGGLTKAAVARWQASASISPAAGYFGAKSRAALSTSAGTTTGGTTTGGTTTGGTTGGTVSGVITTPGAEGTIAVTAAPISNSTVYENDKMDGVIAFNVKATGSDVAVQRVKIDLGANTNLYNKVFQTIYVVDDAGRTLASLDMNSTNVVKDGTDYYATLSGFSSVVPKGVQRTYTVKADIRNSIDTTTVSSGTVTMPLSGVRAVDGAGIDLYGPTGSTFSSALTVSKSLSSSAQLTVSTDANTPLAQEVVAASGSNNNQYDNLPLLVFDIKADKDDVKITDIQNFVITSANGSGATASTTRLFAGVGTSGQILGTAAVATTDADFNNLSFVIPKGTTQAFTLAADVRSANSSATTFTATLAGNTTNVIGTNTIGDTVTSVSGTATGNGIIVRNVGPVFSLNGTPTIARNAGTSGVANGTSTLTANFLVHVKAVGGDIIFGTQSASSTFGLGVYKGGVLTTILAASSTSFTIPSSGVVTSGLATGQSFKVQQNNEVDVPVSFIMDGRTAAGALVSTDNYAVGIESITWSPTTSVPVTSTFMSGKTNWRTAAVALP